MHEALLYKKQGKNIRCELCNNYCIIPEGQYGICKVRKNIDGKLYTLTYGKSTGFALDPIEKKPFFHFFPSTFALSFGTPGCNFHCWNCQNFELSQAPREASVPEAAFDFPSTPPEKIVELALENNAEGVAYTYNEPTIFFEYARDTALLAKKKNLYNVFVSNGYFSREMFEIVKKEKLFDAINIDLKYTDDEKYLKYDGGRVKPVVDNIKRIFKAGIEVEVINLVIPKLNDDDESLKEVAETVASISTDIPLHFSRFFPMYKMSDYPPTAVERLQKAYKIAKKVGMKYVYVGNVLLKNSENTYCPKCGALLIERSGFAVVKNNLEHGHCPKCGEKIYGLFV